MSDRDQTILRWLQGALRYEGKLPRELKAEERTHFASFPFAGSMSFLIKLQKELEGLAATHKVSVSVNLNAGGYLDRACPNAPCGRGFKVKHDDASKLGGLRADLC